MLELIKNNKRKIAISMCLCMVVMAFSFCFASGDSLSDNLDFGPIITAFTDKITPTDIITVVAATITAGMLFVLAWFGIRKVISALRSAIMKGRIKG